VAAGVFVDAGKNSVVDISDSPAPKLINDADDNVTRYIVDHILTKELRKAHKAMVLQGPLARIWSHRRPICPRGATEGGYPGNCGSLGTATWYSSNHAQIPTTHVLDRTSANAPDNISRHHASATVHKWALFKLQPLQLLYYCLLISAVTGKVG